MDMLLHILQYLMGFMAIGLLMAGTSARSFGTLLGSSVYAVGAAMSLSTNAWWPLGAAFAAAWVLRLVGLDRSSS